MTSLDEKILVVETCSNAGSMYTLYGCPLDGRGDRLDWPVFMKPCLALIGEGMLGNILFMHSWTSGDII